MKRRFTRTTHQNISVADSWDVWPLDDGSGYMLVTFFRGRSAVVSTVDGPFIWNDEKSAVNYLTGRRRGLPRTRKLI